MFGRAIVYKFNFHSCAARTQFGGTFKYNIQSTGCRGAIIIILCSENRGARLHVEIGVSHVEVQTVLQAHDLQGVENSLRFTSHSSAVAVVILNIL